MDNSFGNRVFLTKAEWETYLKRAPVRYIRRKKDSICMLCKKPPTKDNPLEHSHKIPFLKGVREFALTPDYLDGPENIVSAHKRKCNKHVEMSDKEILKWIKKQGFRLPSFIKI